MRATNFEFHYRVWFIALIFTAGFGCYGFDHTNAAQALVRRLMGPGLDLGSGAGRHALQCTFALAAALLAAGAVMRTWGSAYLGREVVHDSALRSERVVADGPYRHCRNPLYLGNILGAAGIGSLASRTGWFVLVAGMTVFVLRLIGREESGLLKAQGEAYRAYLAAVPRLWPALRPRLPAGETTARWGQAWRAEAGFCIAAVATIGYAATLDLRYFAGIASVGWAFVLIWTVVKRQRGRAAT
jgi:protein-S-isoprenylcysteine O-methyltransferase Ste14